MKVHYHLDQLPQFANTVLTIGSFDGVHHGHQELLAKINRLAKEVNGESLVITFDPHPRQVLYPEDKSLRLLTTTEEKVALFQQFGIDHVVVVPFTIEFSQQSADEYIEKFLVGRFHPSKIVIGYDHKFGQNRAGDINYLKKHGARFGYEVLEIEPQEVNDIAVSSTKIRNALADGHVKAANKALGHQYRFKGKVVKGQQLGRTLGFPTANIQLENEYKLVPKHGVYAVKIEYDNQWYNGMLSIGKRPSVDGALHRTIEVNIFDFQSDIYGDQITIGFIEYIRDNTRFDSMEELSAQLVVDKKTSTLILNKKENMSLEKSSKVNFRAAIVILNYNGANYLKNFLPKVIETAAAANCSVIVADNASTDASIVVLKANFPSVELIVLKENLGFAQGYNEALKKIDTDYFVLLNSDVEVTEGWLLPCLELLSKNKEIAACQPKIRAYHQRDYFEYAGAAGGCIDFLGYPFCKGRLFSETEKDEGQYDETSEIFWATGAALFIRADLFEASGGFDGAYFAHAEEIDLCWRLRKAGYKIYAVPESIVYHIGGGTLGYQSVRKTYLNFRNTLITSFKNEPGLKLIWWLPLRLVMDGLAGVLFLSQRKWGHIGAIIKAHWHFFFRIPFWWKKRKQYQKIIQSIAIDDNSKGEGLYPKSIVWQFYAKGKKQFSLLQNN